MLKKLLVRNYVLIDALEFEPSNHLTILTGETGAGKSILLGALGLMLGQRADTSSLLRKTEKCIIEGTFDLKPYDLRPFFSEHELDYDDETTIRREISPEGKSRAFINDTPVNLSVLKGLTSRLVDIHSQHENLLLQDNQFQLKVVDTYAANAEVRSAYFALHRQYSAAKTHLAELEEAAARSKADQDYFQFQLNELSEAALKPGESDALAAEQKRLQHAGEMLQTMAAISQGLSNGDEAVVRNLKTILHHLQSMVKFDDTFGALAERLKSVTIELDDIADELAKAEDHLNPDPERLQIVEDRLNELYRLQHKHRVQNDADLLALRDEFQAKVDAIESLDSSLEAAKKELAQLKKQLLGAGGKLTKSRQDCIPALEKELSGMFSSLSMPNAVLRIALHPVEEDQFPEAGLEQIRFLFSANKGGDFKDIGKVASGGELSRVMLCVKELLARKTAMPTIIFDEIDTGISGETASRMGGILASMAAHHQVLVITHLPQIASKGEAHYHVYKQQVKGQTRTGLKWLDGDERIMEIARLLSGEKLTDAAIGNAKELMSN